MERPGRGPDAVLNELFIRLGAEWDGFTVTGTYKATGRAINLQVAHVLTMRDGKVTGFQQYVDTAAMQTAMTTAAG